VAAVKKLWLSSLRNVRRSLARLIKAYHEDARADIPRFRAEVYAMKALVQAFATEKNLEFELRLEELEKRLKERGL
jgi:hypothetical protein